MTSRINATTCTTPGCCDGARAANVACHGCGFPVSRHCGPHCYRETPAAQPMHERDEHCDVDPADDTCRVCGVLHGDPCPTCSGRGFHREHCPEMWGEGQPVPKPTTLRADGRTTCCNAFSTIGVDDGVEFCRACYQPVTARETPQRYFSAGLGVWVTVPESENPDDVQPQPTPKPKRRTLATARAELRAVRITLTKRDGEYRVNFVGGDEATAYYTSDLDDAVATGFQMNARGGSN